MENAVPPVPGPPRAISVRLLPLCRGADVPVSSCTVAGVGHAHRSEEHVSPGAVQSPDPQCPSPVQRAGREEPRESAVQPGLAPVTRAAEKLKVLQCERPPERLGSHRPGDIDGEPVVQLVGGSTAALAHRHLYAGGLLSGCDAVGGQAVVVPGEVYRGCVLSAPATYTADRLLPPARDPGDKSSGVRRWMLTMVHHQSPETSPPHPAAHVLHAVIPPVDPAALSPALLSPIRPGLCVRSGCQLKRGLRRSPSREPRSRRRWSGLVVPSPSATP